MTLKCAEPLEGSRLLLEPGVQEQEEEQTGAWGRARVCGLM